MRTTKRCPSCDQELPWEAFGRDMTQSIGIKGVCKECHNAKQRARWATRTENDRLARNARNRKTYARRKQA